MSAQGESVRLARVALALRGERSRMVAECLYTAGPWDAVLLLFIADGEGRRLTAGEVVSETGMNVEAGRRWMAHLSAIGLVVGDGEGRMEDPVTLSPHALSRMESFIDHARQALQAV